MIKVCRRGFDLNVIYPTTVIIIILFPASAISIINHNISVNKHAFPSVDIKSLVLDWDCDRFPPEAAMPFDLVMSVIVELKR